MRGSLSIISSTPQKKLDWQSPLDEVGLKLVKIGFRITQKATASGAKCKSLSYRLAKRTPARLVVHNQIRSAKLPQT